MINRQKKKKKEFPDRGEDTQREGERLRKKRNTQKEENQRPTEATFEFILLIPFTKDYIHIFIKRRI